MFDFYSEFMPYEEYAANVHPAEYTVGDYGRWVSMNKSFPPLIEHNSETAQWVTVEFLFQGEPLLEWIIYDKGTKSVRFRRYDDNQWVWEEFFTGSEIWWRFMPDPPEGEGYDVG